MSNRLRSASLAISVSAAAVVGALSFTTDVQAQTTTTTAPTTTAAAGPKPIELKIGNTRLGDIITDGAGLSLYMWTPDLQNEVSVCEGQCLVAWPPLLLEKGQTLADVKIASPLRRSKLGLAMRFDGSRQVTYDRRPLYYWFRDKAAGDVLGQWVTNNWFVMNSNGTVNAGR